MTPPPRMKTGKSSVYDPKSGVQLIGVRKGRKGRYEAVMRGPKRSVILLGSFDTPEEAARAYDEEARELRGPKAKTNFPSVEKKYDDDGDDDDTKKGFGTSTSSSPVDVDLQHSDWDFFLSQEDAQLIAEPDDSQKKSTDWSSLMQYLECAQRETELTAQARLIIDSDMIDYDAGARELWGPKAKTNFPPVKKKDDDDDDDTKKGFGTSTSSNPVDVDLQHSDWDFFLSQEDAQLIAEPDDSQKKSTDWSSFMQYLECAQRETELTAQARLITDSDVIDYDAGARELRGPKAKTNFPPVEKKDDDDDDTKKGFGSSTSSRPVDVDLQHSDWDLFLSHLEQEDAQQIGGPDGLQKKNKDWNSFMQYLECAQPETELSALARSITDSDVIDYLGHLIKLRERKVHVRTCPFSHFPSAICTCQANEALEESLYTIAFRLEVAFHDLYNQPHHSNPFASLTVRDYLRVYERGTAEAGGSHGGGGCGAVYSGSTSSATTASIEMKLHQLNLGEIGRKRKLDGLSEDNNMVNQRAGLASRRDQTTSSSKRTGFGLNKLLFGITKKGRSKYAGPKEELMVLDEMGSKSELVQTVDKWTKGRFGDENITGTSPEEGRFGDKLQEAHSILGIEDDLMSFMGSKPFCLQILDLSGTTISSLPKCISELVTLESLTLRDCRLLMELPPEIGELTNLEVLDLLGTEVVCLPKEIAKLVNLRSFRIALCGYADHFKESRGIDYVIPRNALSKLSGLSDLRIHVNPDGDWWDVEVKAVIEDLRDLGNLRTLHLDLPKVDLLDDLIRSITQLLHLSSLRFRLTVGPHEERIIHRLPKHVEKEFRDLERFEKG